MQVGCVIVTYNKLDMLKECIQAILNQSRKVDHIFLVDNNSTDETQTYADGLTEADNNIHYYRLDENIGGAGGFNFGIKRAFEANMDYTWIMDNDTIPSSFALERLLDHVSNPELNIGFLCSNVEWTNGKPCIMNIPTVGENWTEFIDKQLIRVKSASFVSLLVSKNVLNKVGFPIKEFFIWGDDVEFTTRISKHYCGYFVGDSIVTHKMGKNETTDIVEDEPSRISRYYFDFRNRLFIAKRESRKSFIKALLSSLSKLVKVLFSKNDFKFKKIKVIIKGTVDGFFFNPKIEMPQK